MYNLSDVKVSIGGVEVQTSVAHDRCQNTPRLTMAQCIRRSSDPYKAAVASFTYREVPHGSDKHTYYFEDRSVLVFQVTYDAVEDFQS